MKRILILMLTLMIAASAFAVPHRRPHGARDGSRMAELLDLTDEQKSQAKALRLNQRATIQPLREKIRGNREQIEDALAAGNSAKAGELMLASYNLRQQIKAAHESFKTSFAALLTPAQKEKWSVFEEMRQLRRERRGRR